MVSKTIFYPILGVFYFIQKTKLWKSCLKYILLMLIITISTLIGYSFLIKPTSQLLIKHGVPNWLSIILCIIFMLIESAVTIIIFSIIILPIILDQVFDEVLKLKDLKDKIEIHSKNFKNKFVRTTFSGIMFGLLQILVLILTIPINFIPILGTLLYCIINGFLLSWGYMLHDLIELRGMDFKQSKNHVFNNYKQYVSFGSIAFLLELVPIFNWLFIFTNSIGAALWASEEWKEILKDF